MKKERRRHEERLGKEETDKERREREREKGSLLLLSFWSEEITIDCMGGTIIDCFIHPYYSFFHSLFPLFFHVQMKL